MHIRVASHQDYASIAEISTLITPDHPVSAEILSHFDSQREPSLLFARWVAEASGRVVGVAVYAQYEELYRPGEVHVNVRVHPGYRSRGVGAALYEAMIDKLRRTPEVDTLKIALTADQHAGINFAIRRGFTEYARRVEMRASLPAFDPSRFPDPDTEMGAQLLTLRSVNELADDPDRDRKLYDLKWEIEQDVPFPDEIQQLSFESFRTGFLQAPTFVPDASFVALDGDRYVGAVFCISSSHALMIVEMTGTARAYRRRGIAQALKVKSMTWAKHAGYKDVLVDNDLANTGMLAINDKLGFVRQPAIILLRRKAPF